MISISYTGVYFSLPSPPLIPSFFLSYTGFYLAENASLSQPGFTCSKLKIETLEQGVKYVQR